MAIQSDEESVKQCLSIKERLQLKVKLWEETIKGIETHLEEQLSCYLKLTETESLHREIPIDEFAPMGISSKDEVQSISGGMPQSTVYITKFRMDIKKSDLMTLHNLNWLNDEIINFYVLLIQERNESMKNYPVIMSFNSFFYEAIQSRGYDGVKRWTKKENIFEKDIIIIPIHLAVHWCLLTIDMNKKEINYYDSKGSDNNNCLKAMSDYLKAEHKAKLGTELDLSDWVIQNVKGIPQQMNGNDCGVFACTYAEYCSRRAPFEFDQSKMQYFRKKMIYEIITGKLL